MESERRGAVHFDSRGFAGTYFLHRLPAWPKTISRRIQIKTWKEKKVEMGDDGP